jgi:hypothetical protein
MATAAGQARLGEAQARGLPDGRREIEWRMTASGLAALGAFLLLAVVLIALASGGGGDDRGGLPDAAPAEAPLSRQLDALERQVQEADGR